MNPSRSRWFYRSWMLIICLLTAGCLWPWSGPRYSLEVSIENLMPAAPVPEVLLDVYRLNDQGEPTGRRVIQGLSDEQGRIVFQLPAGRYRLLPRAGYSGYTDVDLQGELSVELQVLEKFD